MQVAFCDSLSVLLGRGMRGSLNESKKGGVKWFFFDLIPCTISLSLYISPHVVSYDSPNDHQTYLQQLRHCSSSSPWPRLPPPLSPLRPSPLLPLRLWRDLWPWRGPESSGVTAGRGHCVWGTTRKVTWSVGVATSYKRDVHTATTTPLLLYRNLSPYQYQHTADTHRGGQEVMVLTVVVMPYVLPFCQNRQGGKHVEYVVDFSYLFFSMGMGVFDV